MTGQITDTLLSALNSAGIPAFREYPAFKMPSFLFFVTAAAECRTGSAVSGTEECGMPAVLTLRLRYLCRTDADFELHEEAADEAVYAALLAADCEISGAEREALHYNQTIDRLVCETRIELRGMLLTEQEAEDDDAS